MTRPRTTNRLARSLGTATLITAALSTSACNGSPDATHTATPSESSTPSTSSTQTPTAPTAPVLPSEATGLTVESADAFASFYLQLLDYAAATGDTAVVKRWSDKGCIGCGELIPGFERKRYSGDFMHRGYRSTSVRLNESKTKAQVKFTATVGKHAVEPRAGGTVTSYPGETIHWILTLQARGAQWIAFELADEKG